MFAPFLLAMLTLIVAYVFFLIAYIFIAYLFSRIGNKFRVGSFIEFLIPVYNVMLLCDCANVSRWFTVGIVAPGFVAGVMNSLPRLPFTPILFPTSAFVALVASVYLWGSIAKRLGKNFWIWGILTTLLAGFPVGETFWVWGIHTAVLMGIPLLILAFDNSMPRSDFVYQNHNVDDINSSENINL